MKKMAGCDLGSKLVGEDQVESNARLESHTTFTVRKAFEALYARTWIARN